MWASTNWLLGTGKIQYDRLIGKIDAKIVGEDIVKVLLDVPDGKMILSCKNVNTLCYCEDDKCDRTYGHHSFDTDNGYKKDYEIKIQGNSVVQGRNIIDGNIRKKPDFVVIEITDSATSPTIKLTDCSVNSHPECS